LAQLERVQELIERKRQIFGWYRDRLSIVPGLTLNAEPPGTRNAYWMVTVIWDAAWGIDKNALQLQLDADGIDTRPFFHPLSSLPAYRNAPSAQGARERNPVAYDIASRAINLPSALNLTEDQVDRVCRTLVQRLQARSSRS
jgi:perosamine synthetase